MKSGFVQLDKFTDLAPEGAEEKVATAVEKIKPGDWDVFTGEVKDENGHVKVKSGEKLTDQQLLSIDWFVEGVVGTIPAN